MHHQDLDHWNNSVYFDFDMYAYHTDGGQDAHVLLRLVQLRTKAAMNYVTGTTYGSCGWLAYIKVCDMYGYAFNLYRFHLYFNNELVWARGNVSGAGTTYEAYDSWPETDSSGWIRATPLITNSDGDTQCPLILDSSICESDITVNCNIGLRSTNKISGSDNYYFINFNGGNIGVDSSGNWTDDEHNKILHDNMAHYLKVVKPAGLKSLDIQRLKPGADALSGYTDDWFWSTWTIKATATPNINYCVDGGAHQVAKSYTYTKPKGDLLIAPDVTVYKKGAIFVSNGEKFLIASPRFDPSVKYVYNADTCRFEQELTGKFNTVNDEGTMEHLDPTGQVYVSNGYEWVKGI